MHTKLWRQPGHVRREGHPKADPERAEGVDIFQPARGCLRIPQEQLDVAGKKKKDACATVLSVQPSQIKPGKHLQADERVDLLVTNF